MAKILILSNASGGSADLLPALGLLQHEVRILPAEASVLVDAPITDCILLTQDVICQIPKRLPS